MKKRKKEGLLKYAKNPGDSQKAEKFPDLFASDERMCRSIIYPEFATYKSEMEPISGSIFLVYMRFSSIYAACNFLRKCTYIYDLHKNLYSCLDAL